MTKLIRSFAAAALAAPLFLSSPAEAQEVRIYESPGTRGRVQIVGLDRPMIGVTTNQESERADTLGLLVEDVRRESPAAKAGIKAGDRLQRVNGVSLRADRADAGESDYDGVLSRRLSREIEKTEEGRTVEIAVLSDGRTRNVTLTPVKMSELYRSSAGGYAWSSSSDDRAVLGVSLSSTGSLRDTLGVFVSSVTTDGPADKAGIVEGDRIASINGVSVRVAPEDAADGAVGNARVNRLRRELAKLEAGQVAELVVVTAGRSRTVRVTTVKASDLPDGGGFSMTMPAIRELMPTPPRPPSATARPSVPRAPLAPSTVRGRTIRI